MYTDTDDLTGLAYKVQSYFHHDVIFCTIVLVLIVLVAEMLETSAVLVHQLSRATGSAVRERSESAVAVA